MYLYQFNFLGVSLAKTNEKKQKEESVVNPDEGNGWKLIRTGKVTGDVVCSSWNGFLDFFHHENALRQNQSYVFRGHASEEWKLEPTLKRKITDESTDSSKIEKKTLEAFQKHCLGRRGHNPTDLSESEWWALGQHFGLNTPLLDWSESPYVAAFFAFNSENEESDNVIIWLLSKGVNLKPCVEKLKSENHLEFLTPYLDENARLINQRGLFVRSPNMMCISEWIEEIKEDGTIDLARVLIPRSEKEFALDSLDKMNINDFTLFPDLSGSGKYANYVVNRDNEYYRKAEEDT
ncbi:FRG domain-containing protein [Pseudoalteromonas fuliginea]|uniref:FRG domain-containing protein n=1 Tax=Pseudoalteromonas fuliginea TaxID=1872678 RepID=A0AB73BK91_9GAMM|nr:FRG domain-containing protein [Pseudoalteromonas fuliginea]